MTKAFDDWNRINHFMAEGGMDAERRTLRDYRKFTDEEMEGAHDYIQWMFPTDQPSKFNPHAPLIENDFFGNRNMVAPVLRSVVQFMGFLARTTPWRVPGNHNLLRITRMIRSVKLICGDDTALDLLCAVCEFNAADDDDKSVAEFRVGTDGLMVLDFWIGAVLDSGNVLDGQRAGEAWDASSEPNIKTFLTDYINNQRKEAA